MARNEDLKKKQDGHK